MTTRRPVAHLIQCWCFLTVSEWVHLLHASGQVLRVHVLGLLLLVRATELAALLVAAGGWKREGEEIKTC